MWMLLILPLNVAAVADGDCVGDFNSDYDEMMISITMIVARHLLTMFSNLSHFYSGSNTTTAMEANAAHAQNTQNI